MNGNLFLASKSTGLKTLQQERNRFHKKQSGKSYLSSRINHEILSNIYCNDNMLEYQKSAATCT